MQTPWPKMFLGVSVGFNGATASQAMASKVGGGFAMADPLGAQYGWSGTNGVIHNEYAAVWGEGVYFQGSFVEAFRIF